MKSPLISYIISAISQTVKNTPMQTVKNTGEKYGVREYWTTEIEDAYKAEFTMGGEVKCFVDADNVLVFIVIKI